jgi:hypothetical protein
MTNYHSFSDGYPLEWTNKSGAKKEAYGIKVVKRRLM